VTEAELRDGMAMLENAKAQLDALAKQQQLIQLAIEEHVRARETIKKVTVGAPGDDILIPIGADSYIYAKITDRRDGVVGVGSGVSIQRKPEDAEKFLDGKIDELTQVFKKVADRASQTEAMVEELSAKLEDMYAKMQSAQSG
jgi:prefoldin alpha subunit